jgi:pyrrolidone-carboxylate peptidase
MNNTLGSFVLGLVSVSLVGCLVGEDTSWVGSTDNPVTVDTSSRLARKQYDAEVAFASAYQPRCSAPSSDRPRVLVSGFGRFQNVLDNASGRIVASLGGFAYPETSPPKAGEIDPIGPQLAVGSRRITLPRVGEVDVCAVVLPVVWDLAPILLLRELDAFEPDFVLMTGVADAEQPLWIELGAINKAVRLEDGTGILAPSANAIVAGAAQTRANLLAWSAVRAAARQSREETAAADPRFGNTLTGVKEQAPRADNSYLCNNITYVTGYLMDAAEGTSVPLLVASDPVAGKKNKVLVSLEQRQRNTPRVFLHFPTKLTYPKGIQGGVDLLRAVIDAQLDASASSTRGAF